MNPNRLQVATDCLGYLHDTDGPALNQYALQATGPYVELGSFAGKSACWIGDAAETNRTVLFAVDWHRGSPEMAPGKECHIPEAVDPTTGRHDTLRLLRATIEAAELEDVVIPVAGTSQTVGRWWNTPIGFLFIDACHDDPVLDDLSAWEPHLRDDGWLLFHDSPIPPIARAIDRAAGRGWQIVDEIESLTVMHR